MNKVLVALGILGDVLTITYNHLGIHTNLFFLFPPLCVLGILLTALIHLSYLAKDAGEELWKTYANSLPKFGLKIPYNVIIWLLILINMLTIPMGVFLAMGTVACSILCYLSLKVYFFRKK